MDFKKFGKIYCLVLFKYIYTYGQKYMCYNVNISKNIVCKGGKNEKEHNININIFYINVYSSRYSLL